MKELQDIVSAYDQAVLQNKLTALVTVVQVIGSSYRRPGARMLVTEDGEITGAISGGCLEGDALRKAKLSILQQQNRLEIYDTTDDEDNQLGVQLGCNGIVYILFEPIKKDDPEHPIQVLKNLAQKRKEAMLITVFNPDKSAVQPGTRPFSNEFEFQDRQIQSDIQLVRQRKTSMIKTYPMQSVLYQFIPPPVQLIVVGAGNDTQPLMHMAFLLGWNIVVVDGRPAYATQQRFPKAGKIAVTKAADTLSVVTMDAQTAVVLMTHNYNYDIAVLEQILTTDCPYIGVLGPKKKLHKMLDELREKGNQIREQMISRIYGPVGLDIGAETSEEIALSIIAEIKAVFANRLGASLKERQAEIHERSLLTAYE